MNEMQITWLAKRKAVGGIILIIAGVLLLYLIISLYFTRHFFFHTTINGVNVSLKAYKEVDELFVDYVTNYELQVIESSGEHETVKGQEIGLRYHKPNSIHKIYQKQNSLNWVGAFFHDQNYYVTDLFQFENEHFTKRFERLACLNKPFRASKNVSFHFINNGYEAQQEVYGTEIQKEKLFETLKQFILKGKISLDLRKSLCYVRPKFTLHSKKARAAEKLLNQYVAAKITYQFGEQSVILDGNIINNWLSVDEELEVKISRNAVKNYVKNLSNQFDTVGTTRTFKASTGNLVEIKGGLYGWKINQEEEVNTILELIGKGKVTVKEPAYQHKALSRDNELGNTYVEINITRQHLWFYKDGKLLCQGEVVTGNPNKGNATVTGVYQLNYKQKGVTLVGPGYKVEVTYWMPFFGNMGIHDASWRYAFGGEIYKTRGTHGCVNAPKYLAKMIFENIEAGIPVICYEE